MAFFWSGHTRLDAMWKHLWLVAVACNAAVAFAGINDANSFTKQYTYEEDPHPCARKCIHDKPMTCHYNFEVENYYTLSKACHDCSRNQSDCFRVDCVPGDGHERGVVTVNRKIPGPAIEVCQDDEIVVDVKNLLMSEGTTIHWHGQHMRDTPYMDGVPYVTQCPILPRTTFRYSFKAAQAGTHFWHSHLGVQRADGCYGPLIVRVPEELNPHNTLYDFDLSAHTITLIDWENKTSMEKFLDHHHSDGNNKPLTLLVNGMGRNRMFPDETNDTLHTPLARFSVEQGYRYRFRVINAGFLNCPVEVSVDNHSISVISSDGEDINPVEADSLVSYAGERFDFVLSADQPKNLYWIRFRGLMDCDERYMKAFQVAVLEYKDYAEEKDVDAMMDQNTPTWESTEMTNETELSNDVTDQLPTQATLLERNVFENFYSSDETLPESVPDYENSRRGGKQLNSLNKGTESNTSHISIPDLSSIRKWDHRLKQKPDYQFFLAYDFYRIDNPHFYGDGYEFYNVSPSMNQLLTPQINHISMEMPSFPLLPQREDIAANSFCNENTVDKENCTREYCECPHAYELKLDSVVELVIIDEGFAFDANHPFHLHGNAFRVVAMEKIGSNVTVEQVKLKDRKGLIKRNLLDAPIKDTVTVPDGGYTVVRFQASNPGFWLFHCHLEFHAEIGMALVFKVGDYNEMAPVPPNFPRCGNYMPQAEALESGKPTCSKYPLLREFEKVLFGDYCESDSSGSVDLRYDKTLAGILLGLWFFFAIYS
ncbi:iron transport multicopper oxidase fetC isoform X1 [Dendroctonus ponderosae]|uniref:iron transport multicopper oxidase fetC isoform X1 n=2 Tax=Dendroctonus ponderosae TaxID=77166 RepID=UPI002034B942|nr:iron transport multicopper oxidase fetC isoform X1 [Dendroctonus ponderosae]KAH1012700.1 hypothetical protein HUJ05_011807 [Dendroctonus ponderosae]